ncbi:hypothetical protein [Roseibacillus ishigakijimensis]|uniref:Uncharacterized protein n=1 Tax=Roseibacillus ishigakijimensis TaxID=454146 RepID=A0A934RSI3_9BACT|nr:hypothetical protein [Roseibacillus ishigakijimensis]MBK1833706.1 hypothetical protein [Roseibacillus ishigakijimensis]
MKLIILLAISGFFSALILVSTAEESPSASTTAGKTSGEIGEASPAEEKKP